MTEVSAPELRSRVSVMLAEHQQLEEQLSHLRRKRHLDESAVNTLKKQKLILKDSISKIERVLL